MLVQAREEEISKLKNKMANLRAQVRNFQQAQKIAEYKADFSDTDKLMILESVLLSVVGTEALEPITRRVLASFSNDEFWKENKNKETDKILLALAINKIN